MVDPGRASALRTDHYELTMLDCALADGTAKRRVSFEVFCRRLPAGHRYGVFVGLGRFLEILDGLAFGPSDLDAVSQFLSDDAVAWLADWRFTGDVDAYLEGELYFPYSPVVTVATDFASGLLLETLLLSTVNHDSAVASKASRIAAAAGNRPVIEMGSRRTHEDAAIAAARAAWIAGFASTSNLAAGARYGIPTAGTAAHAWTMVHPGPDGEYQAFQTQLRTLGVDTTLLVDTYDTAEGVRRAVAAANDLGVAGPGAVRLDSGNLAQIAGDVRRLLDGLGATETRIVASGDLDEDAINDLGDAPIDAFGVGTKAVSGLTAPGFVYKLVTAMDDDGRMHDVAKTSTGKEMVGGRKQGWRVLDDDGHAVAEHVAPVNAGPPGTARPLAVPAVRSGRRVADDDLAEARQRHQRAVQELPPPSTAHHGPAIPTERTAT